ncbi:unnamed protein product [Adineta ricciae]|uniref:Amine oxidase n=1 Tax=Adineta ricciae TaxID=249248 RepID=A0A815QQ51_ADIRI|nr:unnamed protein product [Adineta ricciae]
MTLEGEIFDVIVVGCGPSGISAAIELQKIPSLKFTVLEARDRIGGRVFTDITTFGPNAPVDLGAQWIHHYRSENSLHKYHQLSEGRNSDYHFILRSSTTPIFDIDGTRISEEKISQAEKIYNQLYKKIIESSRLLSVDKSVHDVIKSEYDQLTIDSQVKRLVDLSFGFIEQYEAENLDQLSAKSFLTSDDGLEEFNLALPNGFGTFIQQIVRDHQLPVRLNSVVTRIDASSPDSLVQIRTKDNELFRCKYVLVTIPLGCLKHRSIEFVPELPEWKQNAIDTMGYGIAGKIVLQFPYVFWDSSYTTILCTSPRFRFILCRPDVGILHIKTTARVTTEIGNKADQETIDEVMILIRKLFPDANVPEPSRYLITKWEHDPFAMGAYSYFAVGADNQTLMSLARECHERIYWAGEHANYNGTLGCVDSAFDSGQREAKRIVDKLKS